MYHYILCYFENLIYRTTEGFWFTILPTLPCIGNLEFAKLTPGVAHFYNLDGDEIQKEAVEIKWDAEAAEKAGYEHFMIKEIHEQPKAVEDTLHSIVKDGKIEIGLSDEEIQAITQIYIHIFPA